jgi:alkylation response protein AidB-like acyl-CoA dehydrogenase
VRFAFTEEQLLFQQALAELLAKECPAEALAVAWRSEDGRVPGLWGKLAEMGVLGLLVPEAHGGLGLDELDVVLLLQEAGRAAAPEPLLESAAVATPLLRELGGALAARWLPRLASGEAIAVAGLESTPLVAGAPEADLLLLERGGELHALERAQVRLVPQPSVDGGRRLAEVHWEPTAGTRVVAGPRARELAAAAFERGALGAAAQLIGLGRAMLDLTVEYARKRHQFGQPIGSFQAVKHHLASAHLKLELARPLVYHASYSFVHDWPTRARDVSTAKAQVSDAAQLCARVALQCHGAIGYSYEYPLHLWLKRTWALARAWGDAAWHRARVARLLLDG